MGGVAGPGCVLDKAGVVGEQVKVSLDGVGRDSLMKSDIASGAKRGEDVVLVPEWVTDSFKILQPVDQPGVAARQGIVSLWVDLVNIVYREWRRK